MPSSLQIFSTPRRLCAYLIVFTIGCVPTFASSTPMGSNTVLKPGYLNISLTSGAFISVTSRLYASAVHSSDMPIAQTYPNASSTTAFQSAPLEWRVSPSLTVLKDGWPLIYVDTELTLNANLDGTRNDLGTIRPTPLQSGDSTELDVTEGYLRVVGHRFGLELGRSRILFGLGITANPGTEDPNKISVDSWAYAPIRGDITDRARLLYATNGFSPTADGVVLTAGVESVYKDDRIDRSKGDTANGYFAGGSLRHGTHQLLLAGLQREIAYREGGTSSILALITGANSAFNIQPNGLTLKLSGEFNWLLGESTLPEGVFVTPPYDVSAIGGVLRTEAIWSKDRAGLEVGYASGDTNRYDKVQRAFQFDPNYRVGLILFPMLNATHARVAIENAGDPNYRERLPRGVDRTATSGAIENAIYLHPTYTHQLNDSTDLAVSYLYAWRATPHFDVFRSSLNGGVPTSHLGTTNTRSLGQELNLGLAKKLAWHQEQIRMRFYVVGGVAWPTDAITTQTSRVYASSARMEASW